ncbi:molecular chaperone Tir [Massilimicrobiota sp. An142]|uniref:TIR domain-containing protein n=1 Tax=Massilimicrobiota TaxID=1924110 RepID=UPI000B36D59B|nr:MULTISPECIES: TIR domain-containing protein [Massilimicrobiota]OUQ13609.1 molecular chaperone Tir [Massilimicrobiota sp. An142]
MIYNLFISHSWTYSDAYEKLVALLDSDAYFVYKNYSVPKNDPIHNARYDYQLKEAIRNQMKYASCVLILAGVYSTYSKWINIEIDIANELGKKIIAIEPWGAEKTSLVVKQNADVVVKWQKSSILKEIRGF